MYESLRIASKSTTGLDYAFFYQLLIDLPEFMLFFIDLGLIVWFADVVEKEVIFKLK